jgi:hypothetical protein
MPATSPAPRTGHRLLLTDDTALRIAVPFEEDAQYLINETRRTCQPLAAPVTEPVSL